MGRKPPKNSHVILVRVTEPTYEKLRQLAATRKQPVSSFARAYFTWLTGQETSSDMPDYGITNKEEEAIVRMRGGFEEE